MPVTIDNLTTQPSFTDALTIQPSNFEAITFSVFNSPCEVEVWNAPQGRYQQGDWGGTLLVAPGQTTLGRCGGVRFRTNPRAAKAIIAVSSGAGGSFTIAGDYTSILIVGTLFNVTGSTGNDGTYTIAGLALVGSDTVVTVAETVPDSTADGLLLPASQIIVYAWKDDEPVISGSVAPAGNLSGAGGFSPFSPPTPAASGIQFDTTPQAGEFLEVETGGPGVTPFGTTIDLHDESGDGVSLRSVGTVNLIGVSLDLTGTSHFTLLSTGSDDSLIESGDGDLSVQSSGGDIIMLTGAGGSPGLVNVQNNMRINGLSLGFFGANVPQQATPVTLGDVIALLQAYGLCP